MGITAEKLAEVYGITREQQDEFAMSSQVKMAEAIRAGYFLDQIVPVPVGEGDSERCSP